MTNAQADDDLLDAADAARLLGVERSTVKRYEDRGKLAPVEVRWEGLRRKPMFRRSEVEALKRPPKQPPASEG